jgi:hypothetical protein
VDDLASRIAADKEPVKVIIKIQGTADKGTIKGKDQFGTNNHPRREEGGKGIPTGIIARKVGKIRIKSLIRGDKVAKCGRKRGPLKEVNEIKIMQGGGDRIDNTLRDVTSRIEADKDNTTRRVGFGGRGGRIGVQAQVEATIIHNSRKRVCNSTSGIKSVISRHTEAGQGWIPEQHAIGGVSTTKCNACEALTLKVSACTPKAIARTPIVANAAKGEEGTKVRFHPIEEFEWSGVGLGRPKEAGDHIHPKGSLTDSPKPEAFGETGLSKE